MAELRIESRRAKEKQKSMLGMIQNGSRVVAMNEFRNGQVLIIF